MNLSRRFPNPIRSLFLPLTAALSLILAASCAQSSPALNAVSVQILRAENADGGFDERLSVFAFWDDGDGARDFSTLRVFHGGTALEWTVDSSNAAVRLRGKDRWLGSAQLAPPVGESLPFGEYTVTVSDLSGNEASRPINVPEVEFPDRAPVRLRIEKDSWILERNSQGGDFARVFFFLLDDQGKLLYSWRVPESRTLTTTGTLAQLTSLARNARRVQCYAENGVGTAGVLLSPVEME